jgi:hypothetical protein
MGDMGDILSARIADGEKAASQKTAKAVGEHLCEPVPKAVGQRVQEAQTNYGSPWDDLLGSVSSDAPPATNQNVRKALRPRRS